MYDGHGSTRQLADDTPADGLIVDTFSYDAYGVMLGGNLAPGSSPDTTLLYAGEHFDTDSQQYYLRARWYNPSNGRLNRMDPFSGNNRDPQSLHKYLYAHCNPINSIDPSGNMTLISKIVTISVIVTLASMITFPHVWARLGSYGISHTTSPKKIAVIYGELGFIHEWTYGLSGVNVSEFAAELRSAGHNVTYSVSPDEAQFVNLLNTNEIVVVVGHGPDAVLIGERDLYDNRNIPFAGIKLGGTKTHTYDTPVSGTITGLEENVPPKWITANEIDGLVHNSSLEFVGVVCDLGKTNRMNRAINPAVFVGSRTTMAGPGVRDAFQYVVDRVNGLTQEASVNNFIGKSGSYVVNPTNSDF